MKRILVGMLICTSAQALDTLTVVNSIEGTQTVYSGTIQHVSTATIPASVGILTSSQQDSMTDPVFFENFDPTNLPASWKMSIAQPGRTDIYQGQCIGTVAFAAAFFSTPASMAIALRCIDLQFVVSVVEGGS